MKILTSYIFRDTFYAQIYLFAPKIHLPSLVKREKNVPYFCI